MKVSGMKTRAFTLIELLVVIVILAILLSLGGGAAMYMLQKTAHKETIATMQIIHSAIDAYDDANDPPHSAALPHEPNDLEADTRKLLKVLWDSTESQAIIQKLSDAAVKTFTEEIGKDEYEEPIYATFRSFFDAYGTEMRYDYNGGLGGSKRLISAGPDKDFDTDDDIYSDEHSQ